MNLVLKLYLNKLTVLIIFADIFAIASNYRQVFLEQYLQDVVLLSVSCSFKFLIQYFNFHSVLTT